MDIQANFLLLLEQFKSIFYNSIFNRLLILTCSAQFFSMVVKAIINSIKAKRLILNNMTNYGGMPSSHTVFVMSFVFGIAFDKNFGIGSPIFVLSLIVASIVMMDSIRLRGTIDNLSDVLKEVVSKDPEIKTKVKFPKHIRHTIKEVLGGLAFSFIYTILFYLFFYNSFK